MTGLQEKDMNKRLPLTHATTDLGNWLNGKLVFIWDDCSASSLSLGLLRPFVPQKKAGLGWQIRRMSLI